MPKHFFFDLDNTLTRSKMAIAPEHVPIFKALTQRVDVTVVSGHGADMIAHDLSPELGGLYYILGQNGNEARRKDGTVIWKHELSDAQKAAARAFITKAKEYLHLTVKDENDLIEDRGCEIAYSLIGHHEEQTRKEAFDPTGAIREKLLADLSADVIELAHEGVEVRSGGTTVLDMFAEGENKGYNITLFITEMHWGKDDCIYIGDALYEGGNDETVIGIIPTHAVAEYRETYEYLADLLGMPRPVRQ